MRTSTRGALIEILTKPKNALVKQYRRLFEMEGVKLVLHRGRAALGRARGRSPGKTGARGLRSIMESILLGTMFELPGLDGVEEVVINREVAESARQPAVSSTARSGRKAAPEPPRRGRADCDRDFKALRCIARLPICDRDRWRQPIVARPCRRSR